MSSVRFDLSSVTELIVVHFKLSTVQSFSRSQFCLSPSTNRLKGAGNSRLVGPTTSDPALERQYQNY